MFSSSLSRVVLLAIMKTLFSPVLAQAFGGFTMNNIVYGGSGCPQGSLSSVSTISDTRFGLMLSQLWLQKANKHLGELRFSMDIILRSGRTSHRPKVTKTARLIYTSNIQTEYSIPQWASGIAATQIWMLACKGPIKRLTISLEVSIIALYTPKSSAIN